MPFGVAGSPGRHFFGFALLPKARNLFPSRHSLRRALALAFAFPAAVEGAEGAVDGAEGAPAAGAGGFRNHLGYAGATGAAFGGVTGAAELAIATAISPGI